MDPYLVVLFGTLVVLLVVTTGLMERARDEKEYWRDKALENGLRAFAASTELEAVKAELDSLSRNKLHDMAIGPCLNQPTRSILLP